MKINNYKILSVFILVTFNLSVFGQKKVGKVLFINTFEPVAFASVQGVNSNQFYICDQNGIFHFEENNGDKLQFSHVSAFKNLQSIGCNIKDTCFFYLQSKPKNLDEVVILPDYSTFQKKFLALETKDTERKIKIPGVRSTDGPAPEKPPTLRNPLSYLASKISKKELEKKEYNRLINEDGLWNTYYEKLNVQNFG